MYILRTYIRMFIGDMYIYAAYIYVYVYMCVCVCVLGAVYRISAEDKTHSIVALLVPGPFCLLKALW